MPGNPRRNGEWDPARWQREHPLGLVGLSHVTALVHDVDAALGFFSGVLATPVVADVAESASERTARIRLGDELVIELLQPLDPASPEALSLAVDGEGLGALVLSVGDLDAAADYATAKGIAAVRYGNELRLDPASTAGADIRLRPTH